MSGSFFSRVLETQAANTGTIPDYTKLDMAPQVDSQGKPLGTVSKLIWLTNHGPRVEAGTQAVAEANKIADPTMPEVNPATGMYEQAAYDKALTSYATTAAREAYSFEQGQEHPHAPMTKPSTVGVGGRIMSRGVSTGTSTGINRSADVRRGYRNNAAVQAISNNGLFGE
jgi:hypothetical protein